MFACHPKQEIDGTVMTSLQHIIRRWLPVIAAGLLLSGCITLPPQVRKELSPPDGKRANNYSMGSGRALLHHQGDS